MRTDYRVGIQISQALADPELAGYEGLLVAVNLLFGQGAPDYQTAIEGLQWFLQAGDADESESAEDEGGSDNIAYYSFDYDAGRIYSGFRRAYGIDLDKVQMHWFRFVKLMSDLGDCAFTQVIDFRTADLSKMDKNTKATYLRMRQKYALPQPESPEEAEFMALLGGGTDGP